VNEYAFTKHEKRPEEVVNTQVKKMPIRYRRMNPNARERVPRAIEHNKYSVIHKRGLNAVEVNNGKHLY